jgi:methionyl-tRNA formyltransferase
LKIIFFGTPATAVPFLEELLKTEEVVGVVTQPDKPAGRGQKLSQSPVKALALKKGVRVFQPQVPDAKLAEDIKKLNPEAGVVVAYGRLIPPEVFSAPAFGCFNVHFSLLPKYRGAAPMQRALINGETRTGVTTFWIEKTLDTGPVLVQKTVDLSGEDDALTLEQKLIPAGILAMNESIARLKKGDCKGIKQEGEPSYAPGLKKEDGRLDWGWPALRIKNLVRGVRQRTGAFTVIPGGRLKGKRLKILKVHEAAGFVPAFPASAGQIAGMEKDCCFIVKCGDGFIAVDEVHLENKKQVSAWAFWQGGSLGIGDGI